MLEFIQFNQVEKVITNGLVISFLAKKLLAELKEQAQAMGYLTSIIRRKKVHNYTDINYKYTKC